MTTAETGAVLRNSGAAPLFQLSADHREILDQADRYARETLHPLCAKMDAEARPSTR